MIHPGVVGTGRIAPIALGPVLQCCSIFDRNFCARSLLSDRIMMVLVTHAVGFAREVAHRIAYIADGAIAELGPPSEVLDRPKDPGLKEFLRRVRA